MNTWLASFLSFLSLPEQGLWTVFVVSFLSATLLPMGSEPAVFGLVKLNPALLWPAILVATLGNTAGGAVSWWMGVAAENTYEQVRGHKPLEARALAWLRRFGPKACLLSWLPVIGDPLCAVAGWLKLSFWPCVMYMAIGKCFRYILLTGVMWELWPGQFHLSASGVL